MHALTFRIETLEPMRVASVRAISKTPERDAWRKLQTWAGPLGLLADPAHHPVFGFNDPPPVPGHKEYGYAFWISVDHDTPATGDIELLDFPGGCYAVTTCKLLGDPTGNVPHVWKRLWDSVQTGPYRWRRTHELERPHDPCATETEMVLDLYLPVEPRDQPASPAATTA